MLRLKRRGINGAVVVEVVGLLFASPIMAQDWSEHVQPATGILAASRDSPEELLRSDKWQAIDRLGSGQRVRIGVPQVGLIEGYFYGFKGDTLSLSTETGMKPIVVYSMDTLWVLRAEGKKGAIIGGILGAVVGITGQQFRDTDDIPKGDKVAGVLYWVAGGIVLGSLVGILTQSWQQLYP
jgi:hypothetical protein